MTAFDPDPDRRIWYGSALETAASWWRLTRSDGVALGFTSHDRALWFDGLLHEAAPGMLPAAVRLTGAFTPDTTEIAGGITAAGISSDDLQSGRWDGAATSFGIVDWENPAQHHTLWSGTIGRISRSGSRFEVELTSAKARLAVDPLPRTSPGCRAVFCGAECGLSAARFTHLVSVSSADEESLVIGGNGVPDSAAFRFGELMWIDGPNTGISARIIDGDGANITLAEAPYHAAKPGDRCRLIEGCDRSFESCKTRFDNAINFRGEPKLPGNDMLLRYGAGA